ncbi:protein POOR HOMOLOGOUS SYNAPSIS 1 [Malania oleifera]|uniref:protein POOR HOMOLOGOUS SYNAPSIS 1 n=1 Tax=Malania oleifera TaxID=397392 RepID=UPI0025ADC2AB|nr:protein POOR HOMOLOGOUS SYNAPSIS 1 [Malania oleifera]
MAGSMAIVVSEHHEKSMTVDGEQWEIQYCRYFNYPSPSSTSSTILVPLSNSRTKLKKSGTWLSSSSAFLLQLLVDRSTSEVILVVTHRGKIQEEHFLSKLHFSWPQVSCVSGLPPRGIRCILVSYRDSADQIQKFALQFPTICKTEKFICTLKEILNDGGDVRVPSSELVSEISAQSELAPSNRTPCRAREELNFMIPVDTSTSNVPTSMDYRVEQYSLSQETAPNPNPDGILAALPPSFTSLMSNCLSESEQSQQTKPLEVDLRAQIMRFIGDSSFQDTLVKVEKVISEMGYDLML